MRYLSASVLKSLHVIAILAAHVTLLPASQQPSASAPLPDPQQLKQRAMASMKQAETDLERYQCIVHSESEEFNGDGSVKKHNSLEREQFYVNGVEINHTLKKDGKPLTGNDAKKEQERVDKEVKKYSDPKQVRKDEAEGEKQAEMFVRAQKFSNGRREVKNSRSTVVYDLSGDPNFHPHKVEERFAQAISGRIWIDEQTGEPLEMRMQLDHDVKIGGGLLANVHKGFWVHTTQERQPDGVWITKLVEGSGDVRAALFLHPRFHFKQTTDACHLFSVESKDSVQKPKVPAN